MAASSVARPSSARASSDMRRAGPSLSSSSAPFTSHLRLRSLEDGGSVALMLQTLYGKLPSSQYRPLTLLRKDPSFGRPLDAIKKLADACPDDVLRPLLAQASQTSRELPLLAPDDLSFSTGHQALLFLLELIRHVLPAPPASAEDVAPPLPLELDGRIADQLLALAAGQLGRGPVGASETRRSEDSSSFRGSVGPFQGLPRRLGRHEHSASRSTTQSPSLSSLDLGDGGSNGGFRQQAGASFTSAGAASRAHTAQGLSAINIDVHAALTDAASAVIYAVSYGRWDAFLGALRARLQHLASESSIASNPSAADLAEFRTLGACFINRARLTQVTQELSSVFLHIPRIAQAALAEAVYQNIFSFVSFAPDDFVAMHQGAGLQADLSSLFDMAWNSCRDLGVMAPRWARSFWPVMALWLALSPGLSRRVVDREGEGRGQTKGSAGKKVAWFDSLQSSFYLPNFAGVAKRCCIDLVYFSTLLPSGDNFSLKLLVSDFVVELQEQLLYGEDDHRDLGMLSFGLYSLIRRNPRDVLLSSLPDLRTNMVDWQKYAMVKALLMLHKELPGVFFDGDPLFADVGPVLRDFVRALQPDPATPNALLPGDKVAALSEIELELLQLVLEFFTRDVRFLIACGATPNPAADAELGGILSGLASILSAPVPGSLKSMAATCLTASYSAVAALEPDRGAEDVWRAFGNAAWMPLWYAGLPVFRPALSEERSLAASFALVTEMLELACRYSAKFPWYLPAQSAVADGLDMHEAASVVAILSQDPLLAAAGLAALRQRSTRLDTIVAAMSIDERAASLGLQLQHIADLWRADDRLKDCDSMRAHLHVRKHAPGPRTAELVLEEVFQRWRTAGQDIDIMPSDAPEVDDWLHATSFIGSYLGRVLAGEAFRLPGGSSDDLATEFLNGTTAFLLHSDALIRSGVCGAIDSLSPSLAPGVVRALSRLSGGLFDRNRIVIKREGSMAFLSCAATALTKLLTALHPLHLAKPHDRAPITPLIFDVIDCLSTMSADRSVYAALPTTTVAAAQYVRTLVQVCQMLAACVDARSCLGLDLDEQRSLASCVVDTLSLWTSTSLKGFDGLIDPSDFDALDLACLGAAAVAIRVGALVDEQRTGRTRQHLAETWIGVALALASKGPPSRPQIHNLSVVCLSELLRTNGDVALGPLQEAARSDQPHRQATALAALASAASQSSWPSSAGRSASPTPEPALLRLLNSHKGQIQLSPSVLHHISGSSTDNDALAELLLRQSEAHGTLSSMLETLCEVEVATTNGEADIFRSATLTTKVFVLLAKRHALNYFRAILEPFVLAVCEGHPTRFETESRSSTSRESPSTRSLELLAQTCFDRICDSVMDAPPVLQEACRILGETFEQRFPGLRRRAISSFIVLRMLSPAMISPSSIHIAHPSLSGAGRRALVEVSKLLVHLANDASLGKAVAPDEYADFLSQQNIRKMVGYLDGLQAGSTIPATSPPSASDDSADELLLRLYLSSNLASFEAAPGSTAAKEQVLSSLTTASTRSTMTLGRVFRPEQLSAESRSRASLDFMSRCSTRPPHPLESFLDISVQGKNIYAVDFGGVLASELDTFLYAGLLTVGDALGPFSLVLDCSTLPATSSASQANLTTWLFAALQVVPDELASLCQKVILWCPNSSTIKAFRRVRSLLAISDCQGLLDAVIACSGSAALAHHLDVPEDEIMLPSLLAEDGLLCSDVDAEVVDVHGQRRPVLLTLTKASVTLRHLKLESLHGQHGHPQVVVKDVYGLRNLERVGPFRALDRTAGLRLVFRDGVTLDLVLSESDELQKHLPVISRGIASSIPTPAQTCSQLFVQGLICLTALDDVVRAAAYRLLVAIVDSGKIACPDLPTLKGFHLPLAVEEEVGILAEQAARCNAHLAPIFIRELCLAVASSSDHDLGSHLSLLEPFLRVAMAALAPGGATESSTLQVITSELVDMTQAVLRTDQRAMRVILRFWEVVSALDSALVDLALEQLLSSAMTGSSANLALIGEVILVLSKGLALAPTLLIARSAKIADPKPSADLGPQKSNALQLLLKLSYCRRSHSHLIISLPELLLTSMRALVADVEDEATALAILSNAFLSLAETTSLDEIHRGLECLAQLTSAARPIPGHAGPSPSARSELTDGICSELKQLLRIVASNDDQYNAWTQRWIGLALGAVASDDESLTVVGLSSLTILLGHQPPTAEFFHGILEHLARELELSRRPHVLVGLVRLLEALVAQLETDSVVSLFWIGLGITSLGSALLSGGVRLVAATLAALERPSPRDLCVFLDRPLCSFLGDALEEDWGVRFGEDESFALGVLSLLFKGLCLPASAPATRETLLLVLSLLLQDAHMPAAEQMCYLAALSVSGDGLARCKALFAETGRSLSDLEHVQLPESSLTVASLAFIAGPCLDAASSDAERSLPLLLLARAAASAPASLSTCRDLLLPQIEQLLANSTLDRNLHLAATLYPFAAATTTGKSLDRLMRTLADEGIPFLHMCHEATEPRSEAIRRLSFITSVYIKAELARLTDVEDLP